MRIFPRQAAAERSGNRPPIPRTRTHRFRHKWRLGACYFRGHDGDQLVAQLDKGVVIVKLRLVSLFGEGRLERLYLYLFEREQNVLGHASHDNSMTRLSECRA